MGFVSVLSYAHKLVEATAQANDIVIDATTGNGIDTEFLAKIVQPRGKVYGFDIQAEAIQHTRERLSKQNFQQVEIHLFQQNHANMAQFIPQAEAGQIAAIMFNLGYLPGSDQKTITQATSTIPALEAALGLLRPNGVITVVLYPGHEGGQDEAVAVHEWAAQLPPRQYQVLCYQFINQTNRPPYLIAITKK